ncbi:DUF397 domain-containing protein [Streptosporangium amethystogenes subsp. fukuiense]|uniref:DUF397 domain-containing protein n=1 Tax=Streptosporangium amethystogenes subsp. fukuiense TaxID=698418 RepID=A0ABW2T327_9ACTN
MSMIDLSQVVWRKSGQSNANGGQCVEVGVWRKSSLGGNGQNCVEAALANNTQGPPSRRVDAENIILVRDSKDPGGSVLTFTLTEWNAFLARIKGDHVTDLP